MKVEFEDVWISDRERVRIIKSFEGTEKEFNNLIKLKHIGVISENMGREELKDEK